MDLSESEVTISSKADFQEHGGDSKGGRWVLEKGRTRPRCSMMQALPHIRHNF